MKTITVDLKQRSYNIVIGNDILKYLPIHFKKLDIGTNAVIITNAKVERFIGSKLIHVLKKANISYKFEMVPDSEQSKSQDIAFKLINRISVYGQKKQLFIIALGGGVIGDLAGFVASIYKRGVPYIQLPTTLLAQIDSSIGGKVGIDLDCGKNMVGAFYQPRLVFCELSLLNSLAQKQIRNGLAEAVKYGIIKDKSLFEYIERNYMQILGRRRECLEYVVNKCAAIKAKIVSVDEKETKGVRTILNFGHTIGHAIEAAGEFRSYDHGEAIGLGMLAATKIAADLKILTNLSDVYRIEAVLKSICLPVRIKGLSLEDIITAQFFDKKFIHGKNRFILPQKIGQVVIKEGIAVNIIRRAIRETSDRD